MPNRLPEIDTNMISEDPAESSRILSDYEKNLPRFMKDMKEPVITAHDTWEYPNVSTEVSIFNRRIDNTTPQIVDVIRRVANYNPLTAEGRNFPESIMDRFGQMVDVRKNMNLGTGVVR